MGSPFYMAPEQWSDDEPDARADIYSLGIILYQMLAGDVPFKGSSIPSIMKKHLTLPPPSFKSVGVDVSPQLEAVVRHAAGGNVATAIAFDHDGDCGIYNMSTVEEARRRGLGTALAARHVHDAVDRGCSTASLQSTAMAERVYAAVGFRDLGRFLEYVP